MFFAGLDVHWRTSTFCILDEHGRQVKMKTVKGSWDRLIGELERFDGPLAVAYEASCGYGALHDRLKRMRQVRSVTVAHPRRLRLIFSSKRKNDRVDAKKLAMLLMLDQLPAVWVPSPQLRSWRRLIEYRQSVVNRRTRVKNSLRSMMRGHGIVMPRGLWTKKGLVWLGEVELPSVLCELEREQLLDDLQRLERNIKRVEEELERLGREHAGVALLQTIPGVGPRTAEAVVAYIGDPMRFSKNKAIGDYFGLVPRQDSSGEVNRLGHITREGPAVVRRLIVEATWQARRLDERVGAYYERLVRGRDDRKKVALVGTAHYLLRVMLAMLQSGECWRSAV